VLILAAATLMLVMGPTKPERNDAIERAVSMLVVGCPCPLLLASPLAIMCGLSRAARAGIAIKAGKFLEAIRQVRTVVFDKTGTVTTGNIKVVGVDTVPGFEGGEARLMTLAAAAEVKSNHPLAQAVLREAKARNLPAAEPASFEQVGGLGVKAEHDGRKLVVGSRKLMEKELGAEAFAAQSAALTGGLDDGRLHVFVAVDGKLSGLLRMEDTIRDDAAETVARLKEMGIERIVLLTGDRKAVAERVGAAVGITEVRADLLPEQKIAFIRELQAEGLKVAMVGDGVNDAPALGAADVGIAVGDTATDVALEVANASILSGHLRQLPFFLDVSRATVSTVHWNLGIACGFNAIALLASGAGLFAAAVAAVVHVIATLVIILNSLSLNRRSERPAGEDADSDANAYGGGPAVEAASMRFLRREPATPAASVPATARP
jgi:Cu+-exporting ATPase